MPGARRQLAVRLFEPADLASRVVLRVCFGLLAALEAYRLVWSGEAETLWLAPAVMFSWPGLGWLAPWPGDGIYLHCYALVLLGLAVAAGAFYRLTCPLLCLGWAYLLGLCETSFGDGLYLTVLLGFLLALTPAHRALSLDAWRRPALRAETAPAWSLCLLRAQLAVVIAALGVAMLDPDWLQGYPLRLWLPERQGLPLLGWLHGEPEAALAASWAFMLLHVCGAPALLWRRSRGLAAALLAAAWLWVDQTFAIPLLPWLLLASLPLFLAPDWPRRILHWPRREPDPPPPAFSWDLHRRAVAAGVAAYVVLQVLLPLRGFLSGGGQAWSYQGHSFSWRILTDGKTGAVHFLLTDPETEGSWRVDPDEELTPFQYRMLAASPRLLQRTARRLSQQASHAGATPVRVQAQTLVSLNGREPQRLVDPTVDLAASGAPRFGRPAWVLPLEVPLAQQWQVERGWPPPRSELRSGGEKR